MTQRGLRFRRAAAVAAASTALLLVVTACGDAPSTASGGQGGGLPKTVTVWATMPLTGPTGFFGELSNKALELAVEEVNDTHFLGDTTLDLITKDTGGNSSQAASLASQAVADKKVSAVFGSIFSGDAVAQSAIAQQAGLPIVYTQAGSDGVVVGDYTYRFTPLMNDYYPVLTKFVQEQHPQTIAVMYDASNPTMTEVATKAIPAMAEEVGATITTSIGTQATTTDYTSPVSQLLSDKPDLVAAIQLGAASATVMTELRRQGYTGPVLGNGAASSGNLEPAGAAGNGMVWASTFSPDQQDPTSQKFVTLYEEAYNGEEPRNYSAESYDAVWFLARALKEADSADRAAVKDAMQKLAGEPFDGALGTGLRMVDNSVVVAGKAIEYRDGKEVLLYTGELPR